jgi:phage baseplate assembly protein W
MARVLTLPLALTPSGALATVTQDHPAEIAQSVGLLLDTRPGERRTLPDYGLPERLFVVGDLDEALIAETISEWEPRADVEILDTVKGTAYPSTTVQILEES